MQGAVKYKRVEIWYFSGTGNAKFAAEQIKENVIARGIPARVYNIAKPKKEPTSIADDTLVGFCYPTHGFNAPPIIYAFLKRFPRGSAEVFLLNTRAGLKLSKLHLPGIGGMALWLPALILLFKGYKPIGFRPLDMPSNWILLHPGLRKNVIISIKDHCTQTLMSFTNRIIYGKRVNNGLYWLPLDIWLWPISLAYYFLGRFALAKTLYANHNCNNCDACIKECPVQAIIEKKGRPFWTLDCESCMHCINICPQRAIETAHGYLLLIWWLAFSYAPVLIMKLLVRAGLMSQELYLRYFDYLFYGIMMIVSLVIINYGYEVWHWLMGFKKLNKVITYTSLTHYSWWRRYWLSKLSRPK